MATPVAHSLVGLAVGLARFLPRWRAGRKLAAAAGAAWPSLLACVLLANAPDVDYLFGLPAGDLNRYHQTVTHTLVWVGCVTVAVGFAERGRAGRASAGLALALLASHLLLDWLTVDRSPPVGQMLAWPVSDRLFHAPFAFIPPPAKADWAGVWSAHNLVVGLAEALLTAPLVLLGLWWKRRPDRAP